MSNLSKTAEEILLLFNNGKEIPGWKFLELEIALQQYKANESTRVK